MLRHLALSPGRSFLFDRDGSTRPRNLQRPGKVVSRMVPGVSLFQPVLLVFTADVPGLPNSTTICETRTAMNGELKLTIPNVAIGHD